MPPSQILCLNSDIPITNAVYLTNNQCSRTVKVEDPENWVSSWKRLLACYVLENDISEKMISLDLTDL